MSLPDVLDQINYAAYLAFRQFVPRTEDREALTWQSVPQALLFIVPYLFMAYLWKDPYFRWYEWNRGLMGLVVIAKSIDFALAKEGRFKINERSLPAIYESENKPQVLSQCDRGKSVPDEVGEDRGIAGRLLPCALYDALEVGLAMRGIGWDFGQSLYIPSGEWPPERNAFIRAKLLNFARNELYVDIWETVEKLTPGVSSTGGTIFLPHLPPLQRYAFSMFLQLGHGLLIVAGMSNVYDIFSIIGVLCCGSKPEDWPPMMGDLWNVRSLHQFWSQGWHQALRYTFLTFGGFPGRRLGGSVGMVFGTFLASALFHEIGIATTGVDMDGRVFVFFLLQAVGVIAEKTFRMLTGRRVGGVFGFTWAAVFILGLGQICRVSEVLWLFRKPRVLDDN
ncbi:hypothetical protein GSI_13597 [Ganoderma sinense ZZ0214-1]|uniref:Wax synthase domain-containing protein n=1 Tax=Ganoderma sinense ZZ0214-1 TaxID=1077348 RepID=A0A2G8RQQ5_9APHY|nr:hypothetical protein GSI_13597 [Ganoderma sinense ZZ0214-1]